MTEINGNIVGQLCRYVAFTCQVVLCVDSECECLKSQWELEELNGCFIMK